MGQRHQLFVIARINGRHRSLAMVHHQFLYGISAIQSCTRLINIFNEPYNRRLIELELGRAARLPLDVWTKKLNLPEFPFITTCLMHGAATDFSNASVRNVEEMSWNGYFNEGDNNDGITVLDVTVPQVTRYCFVHWNISSYENEEGEDPIPAKPTINLEMVPLTGEEYLSIYKTSANELLEVLHTTPLIPTETLQETWPSRTADDAPWQNRQESGLPTTEEPSASSPKIASLAEITMEKSIERLLNDNDALQEDIEELPIFHSSLRKYLARQPEVVTARPFGFDMLQRALRGAKELDLRPFPDLSGEQILALIENAASDIELLDVSFNRHFTLAHLSRIPSTHAIRRLCAWDNDHLRYEDLKAYTHIEEIVHRKTFLDAFQDYRELLLYLVLRRFSSTPTASHNSVIPCAESARSLLDHREHDPKAFNLRSMRQAMMGEGPAFLEGDTVPSHANLASQLIWVQVRQKWDPGDAKLPSDAPLFSPGSNVYQVAKLLIDNSRSYDLETIFYPVVLPLHDVRIGPEALLSSVYWAMRALSQGEFTIGTMDDGALMLAWALTMRHHESPLRLDSLPPRLYTNARAAYRSNAVRIGSSKIAVQHGKWNVLLIQEILKKRPARIRLGFLTADGDEQLRVCDATTFLEETGAATFKDTRERLTSNIKGRFAQGYVETGIDAPLGLQNYVEGSGAVDVVPCDEGTVRNLMALMEIVNKPSTEQRGEEASDSS